MSNLNLDSIASDLRTSIECYVSDTDKMVIHSNVVEAFQELTQLRTENSTLKNEIAQLRRNRTSYDLTCIHHTDAERAAGITCPVCAHKENTALKRNRCDHCGAKTIDGCMHCGAPVCCPQCCAIDRLEQWNSKLKKRVEELEKEVAEWNADDEKECAAYNRLLDQNDKLTAILEKVPHCRKVVVVNNEDGGVTTGFFCSDYCPRCAFDALKKGEGK